jgi:hypothetical protein
MLKMTAIKAINGCISIWRLATLLMYTHAVHHYSAPAKCSIPTLATSVYLNLNNGLLCGQIWLPQVGLV